MASGTHDVVIAGGVEHMGHVPIDSPAKISELYGDPWPDRAARPVRLRAPGRKRRAASPTAGQLGREEMDEFAARSHQNAAKAIADGRFGAEMVPMTLDGQLRNADQCVRPETTMETLAKPQAGVPQGGRPDHRRVVVADQRRRRRRCCCAPGTPSRRLGLRRRARVLDQTTVGVDPDHHADRARSPRPGSCCERNSLSIDDIDLFEVNEAFSSVVLAWQRELKPDMDRVNVNGGAIALGHAVGATGARLIATLRRRDWNAARATSGW